MKVFKVWLSFIIVLLLSSVVLTSCGNPAPTTPTAVSATPGDGQVTIAWTPVSDAISYNIYWSATTGVTTGTTTNGILITGATTPYTLTGLTNGTIYYFVVTSVFATGESAGSPQVSAMPSVNPVPAAPAGVTVTPGNGQATISWTTVQGATSYNIYWLTTTPVTPANGNRIAGVSTPPYTQTGLSSGTTYYYVVTAVNGNGESTASTPQVSITP